MNTYTTKPSTEQLAVGEVNRYLGRYASEITVARAEHPLVICCCAPDNKREERATIHENKFSKMAVTHPRHRYMK
jgi:pectate lyase